MTRLSTPRIPPTCWLVLAATAAFAANASAAVAELEPHELAAFLARHPLAAVQFTSPDRGCGYCTGADKTFDEAAANPSLKAVAFARVQWSPWRKMPDFGGLLELYGVPEQHVFRNGKSIGVTGGRPANADQLRTKIEALVETQPTADAAPRKAAARPPALSEVQAEDVRLGVRHTVMRAVTQACGQRFPALADRWQGQLTRWVAGHRAALDRNALLMLQRTAPGDDAALRQLQQDEQRALQAWQMNKLGIAMDSPPREQDCQRVLDGLSDGARDAPRQAGR